MWTCAPMRTHAHTHGCTGAQALVAERHQIDPSLLSTARWRKPATMTAIHGEAGRDWRNALMQCTALLLPAAMVMTMVT